MTIEATRELRPSTDHACTSAVREAEQYFIDQAWSYPPNRVAMAIELMGTLGRYLTDAMEHSGRLESSDLDRHFDLVCALTEMTHDQRRLYWLLARWARDCAAEGTLDGKVAIRSALRFQDAHQHASALGDALTAAHNHIGDGCDRRCAAHEPSDRPAPEDQ